MEEAGSVHSLLLSLSAISAIITGRATKHETSQTCLSTTDSCCSHRRSSRQRLPSTI